MLRAAALGTIALGGIGFDRTAEAQDLSGAITQLAKFRIDPERREEAVAALAELASAVEEKEPGVLAYIPHLVAGDDTQVVFFEVYEDQAALDDHGQQPHLQKLRESFGAGLFRPLSEETPVEIVRLDRIAGFWRC